MQTFETTIQVTEDLNASTAQYHAIALNDGKLAANGSEASGIIQNKPKNTEAAEIVYLGESRFAAGGAVNAGAKLTVTTSGWVIAAPGSGYYIVGRAKAAVTSGSIGIGFFNFASTIYASESLSAV
jgi:hypothetical protein